MKKIMMKIDEWDKTFMINLNAIKSKITIFNNELESYNDISPKENNKIAHRIQFLKEKVAYYTSIINEYESTNSLDEVQIGDVVISPTEESDTIIETEYGEYPVIYLKSKDELIDEYYATVENLNQLRRTDVANRDTYVDIAEKYYFRYALLISKAPLIKKGIIDDSKIKAGTIDDYQTYINQYNFLKRMAIKVDNQKVALESKKYILKNQYMNLSDIDSIEKNKVRMAIAAMGSRLVELNAEYRKYCMLSEQSLIKLQTIKGEIDRKQCAYLIARMDSDDRVNRELSNIEMFEYELEINECELILESLRDNPSEERKQELLKQGSMFEQLKETAENDLSDARRNRLKKEILHAYNMELISLEEKNDRLEKLSTYKIVNEAVENELSLLSTRYNKK